MYHNIPLYISTQSQLPLIASARDRLVLCHYTDIWELYMYCMGQRVNTAIDKN